MLQRRLFIPGRYEYVKDACQFVIGIAAEAGMNERDVFHCQLAVDEACTNIVEHAYGGEDRGEIEVTCEFQRGELKIVLHDHGAAFDPSTVPDPGPFRSIDDAEVGGQGWYFIRKVMDKVDFTCDADGNTLIMVKRKS